MNNPAFPPAHFIDREDDLVRVSDGWMNEAVIGIDTEFVRTDTYFSIPGLIQVQCRDASTLIDPLAISDLSAFAKVLSNPSVLKVIHSGAEDISLLLQLCAVEIRPLFDTQIAAGFCGFGPSESYQRLVQQLTGRELDKSETRSDWRKRPLTDAQLHYAAEDVRYLEPMWRALNERLISGGRSTWVEEEVEDLLRIASTSPTGETHAARIKGAGRLARSRLPLLYVLFDWREQLAATNDRPRGHILADRALVEIVESRPQRSEALSTIDGVSPRFVRRYGADVLELIKANFEAQDPLPIPIAANEKERDLLGQMRTVVKAAAESEKLAPELIGSKRQLEALLLRTLYGGGRDGVGDAESEPPLSPLRGWRGDLVGNALIDTMDAFRKRMKNKPQ